MGDEIAEFGSVKPSNFHNLQNIASVVQHSEGVREVIQLMKTRLCFICVQLQRSCISRLVYELGQKSVSVVVIRNGQKVRLSLTPQRWSGRGLLG